MKKKILSLALALLMLLSLMPTMALADTVKVTTQDELNTQLASAAEGTVVEVAAGDYILTGHDITNNITVKAEEGANVVFDCTGSGSICGTEKGVTFENITFNFGTSNYHGFQSHGVIIMNGCTLNGLFFSYWDMVFNGCTFNAPGTEASGVQGADYSMWAYSGNLTYKNSIFNCAGKCINVYNEGNDHGTPWSITVEGCTFNSSKLNKAAFNVKETCGGTVLKYDVQVATDNKVGEGEENNQFPTFTVADNGDRTLVINPFVQVDDRLAEGSGEGEQIKVAVGGNEIYSSPAAEETAIDASKEAACNLIDAVLGEDASDEAKAIAEAQKAAIMAAETPAAVTETTVESVQKVEEQIEKDKNGGGEDEPSSGGLFANFMSFILSAKEASMFKDFVIVDFVLKMVKLFFGTFFDMFQ